MATSISNSEKENNKISMQAEVNKMVQKLEQNRKETIKMLEREH
jgi:hypothetical protein